MKLVLNDKMKFRNLLIILFAYLRLVFVVSKRNSIHAEEDEHFEKYQQLGEKKIHFTGNSGQVSSCT